jgi:hypothetical protein
MKTYILEGPADAGNLFGFWKPGLIPAGKFAVVEDGEISNGGYGPSIVTQQVFNSREEAEIEIRRQESGDKRRYHVTDEAGTVILEVQGHEMAEHQVNLIAKMQKRPMYLRGA